MRFINDFELRNSFRIVIASEAKQNLPSLCFYLPVVYTQTGLSAYTPQAGEIASLRYASLAMTIDGYFVIQSTIQVIHRRQLFLPIAASVAKPVPDSETDVLMRLICQSPLIINQKSNLKILVFRVIENIYKKLKF